jgi:hypothetical protein
MRAPITLVALLLALALAACGGSSLSHTQLRSSAARICTAVQQRAEQIPTPEGPADAAGYLSRGVAALEPAVTKLRALHPPGDLADHYRSAVDTVAREVTELHGAIKGLKAGNDPVVAIKTLQQHLAPLERRADDNWRSIDIPACVTR